MTNIVSHQNPLKTGIKPRVVSRAQQMLKWRHLKSFNMLDTHRAQNKEQIMQQSYKMAGQITVYVTTERIKSPLIFGRTLQCIE